MLKIKSDTSKYMHKIHSYIFNLISQKIILCKSVMYKTKVFFKWCMLYILYTRINIYLIWMFSMMLFFNHLFVYDDVLLSCKASRRCSVFQFKKAPARLTWFSGRTWASSDGPGRHRGGGGIKGER